MHRFIFPLVLLFIVAAPSDQAVANSKKEDKKSTSSCDAMDRPCLLKELDQLAGQIETPNWRDQTYRELAKTYTYEGEVDKALGLIDKIQNNDTKAMTIRGIGMAVATTDDHYSGIQRDAVFAKLTDQAASINHPPSQGIAYTYIAMSQAFAGDDAGARATAAEMENEALRNKAYGETAEIDAERGDLKNALLALDAINTQSYRNKAYDTVSRIFLDKAYVDEAYTCAGKIENPYLKAKSIQRILNKGNAEEEDLQPKEDLTKAAE